MTFKKSIVLLLSGSMLAAAALTGCGSDNTAAAVSKTEEKDPNPNFCSGFLG